MLRLERTDTGAEHVLVYVLPRRAGTGADSTPRASSARRTMTIDASPSTSLCDVTTTRPEQFSTNRPGGPNRVRVGRPGVRHTERR